MIVVQIGLRKTGTRSLMEALEQLGWRVLWSGNDEHLLGLRQKGCKIFAHMHPQCNAFCDGPYYKHIARIDQDYPEAVFIYTPRNIDDWVASAEASRRRKNAAIGDKFRAERREHYLANQSRVLSYFSGDHPRLLVLPICHGAGWELLCPFLSVPKPACNFPAENLWRRGTANERRQSGYQNTDWMRLS